MSKTTQTGPDPERIASFNKAAYDIDYKRRHIVEKRVTFNRLQDEDMAMLTWAESHGNFVGYVKSLIRQDMNAPASPDPESREQPGPAPSPTSTPADPESRG